MLPTATVQDRYTDEDAKRFYRTGFWQDTNLFDLVEAQAQARPDKIFASDGTTNLTFRDLRDRGARLALGLRRLGIRPGDRVAVQLPNWSEFTLIATALGRIGGILVPIMPIFREDEVEYLLTHSGAKAAITCEQFKNFGYVQMYSRLRSKCPELQEVISVRSTGADGRAIPLEELVVSDQVAGEDPELGPHPSPDDGFLIVYTSGTTSRPKGCFHTLNTVRASSAAIARSLDYRESDVQFGPSPITHSTGLVTSMLLPLQSGAASHLMDAWEPNAAMRRIAEYGCTSAVTATAFLEMLLNVYDPDQHDPSSMRLWVCAGAPVPASVVHRAEEMLGGCRILSLYGRSENFLTTMCTVDDAPERSATSDGAAVESTGASVQVVDDRGEEVARGTEGDIAYKGPSHMIEYFRDPEQTAALFTPDGYSRSGDLGYMDQDGYVRVTGRSKDIVIRGGLNISARELEELLAEHPLVANVAVVAMPDARLGEKVCAYVVPADPADRPSLESIVSYLRGRRVATPKLPERLELVEELPLTATGKVQKHVLRDDIKQKLQDGGAV